MNGRDSSHIWQTTKGGLFAASHNELRGRAHISDFPDQAEITAFLRSLIREGRTQPKWASDSGIPYNTLTNYFTEKPPKMSAENFLRLVLAADGSDDLNQWLAKYGATIHTRPRAKVLKPHSRPRSDAGKGRASGEG